MDWPLFLIFFAATAAAASTGAAFKPGDWYDSLLKPAWTPKKWMFPVVWTILYLASAYSAMRVALLPGAGMALAFWAMQVAFNTLWSPVFFGLHNMRAALVVMAGLWVGVAGCLVTFWQLDTVAGLWFVPYLIWVTVAGALNYRVMRLNPDAGPLPQT